MSVLILVILLSRRALTSWTVESTVLSAAEGVSQTKRRAPSSIIPCQRRSGSKSSVLFRRKIRWIRVRDHHRSSAETTNQKPRDKPTHTLLFLSSSFSFSLTLSLFLITGANSFSASSEFSVKKEWNYFQVYILSLYKIINDKTRTFVFWSIISS